MKRHEIQLKNATLRIQNVESRDGTVICGETVTAHILRNNGGKRFSVYVYDKRSAP
ncbi:MAG: hypothetical protein ACFFEU_15885 [Candidatus Thorarchaeota archaeon]